MRLILAWCAVLSLHGESAARQMTKVNLIADPSRTQVLGHPLFHDLPVEAAHLLLLDSATLHVEEGDTLFSEGDLAVEYLYVRTGQVEVLRRAHDGQERVFHIFSPGQLLAETAMFMSHGRYPMCARARSDGIVQCLKRSGLIEACRIWPELSLRLLARLSDRVYHRINEIEWFSDSTAAQRLADYLLQQSAAQGESMRLPLTQRQLAASLGIRAETLSRLLADWAAQGHIAGSRRNWSITNRAYLEELVLPARRKF